MTSRESLLEAIKEPIRVRKGTSTPEEAAQAVNEVIAMAKKKQKLISQFCEESGINFVEIEKKFKDKGNFTKEEWELVEQANKEIAKIRAMVAKSGELTPPKPKKIVKKNWLPL